MFHAYPAQFVEWGIHGETMFNQKITAMRNGLYYLNNSGSRWVVYESGKKTKTHHKTKSGKKIIRTVIFYEAFGNFATACISYKGKKIKVFPDTILPD